MSLTRTSRATAYRELADLVRRHTRATETLFRYGGEEFVLLVESHRLSEAARLAEKLRRLIEGHRFGHGLRLTVSIGCAEIQRVEGRQGWFSRADDALLEAKRLGRNRVEIASQPSPQLSVVATGGSTRS